IASLRISYTAPGSPVPKILKDFTSNVPFGPFPLGDQTINRQGKLLVEGRTFVLGELATGVIVLSASLYLTIKVLDGTDTVLDLTPNWTLIAPSADGQSPTAKDYAIRVEFTFNAI